MYLHANAKLGLARRLALCGRLRTVRHLRAAAVAFGVAPATAHRLPGSPPNLTPTLYLACARAASVDPRNGRSVVDAYDGEHPADPAPLAYSITLPEPVDADAIDASLETGVLKVTVPKSKPSQRRRIELK
jgi:hypothetical protein